MSEWVSVWPMTDWLSELESELSEYELFYFAENIFIWIKLINLQVILFQNK